jgi:hypothetical protein
MRGNLSPDTTRLQIHFLGEGPKPKYRMDECPSTIVVLNYERIAIGKFAFPARGVNVAYTKEKRCKGNPRQCRSFAGIRQ